MFRNPFDSWTNAMPRPKKFGMPNQTPSVQNRMMSQSNPWREEIFNDTMTNPMPSQTQAPQSPGNEWGSYLSEMKDLYTRQGPSQQAYEQHLQNLPQYQKPGKMHRLGSVLVGAATGFQSGAGAGWQAGQEALNLPHRRAMEEWATREQGLGRQAEMEDKATGRKLSYMKEVRELAKDDQQYRKMMRDFENEDRKFTADERYRDAQVQNWRDQGYRETTNKAGDTIFVNPRSGEQFNAGPSSKVRDWDLDERRLKDSQARTQIQGGQLGVSRGQLALGQRSQDRLERNENAPIAPDTQSDARKIAIARVNPENAKWAKFISDNGDIKPDVALDYPQEFERFMRRITQVEDEVLGRRRQPAERIYDY